MREKIKILKQEIESYRIGAKGAAKRGRYDRALKLNTIAEGLELAVTILDV